MRHESKEHIWIISPPVTHLVCLLLAQSNTWNTMATVISNIDASYHCKIYWATITRKHFRPPRNYVYRQPVLVASAAWSTIFSTFQNRLVLWQCIGIQGSITPFFLQRDVPCWGFAPCLLFHVAHFVRPEMVVRLGIIHITFTCLQKWYSPLNPDLKK